MLPPAVVVARATGIDPAASPALGGALSNPWFYAVLSAVALTAGAAYGIWRESDRE